MPLQWLNDGTTQPGLSNVRQAQLRYSRRLRGGLTLKASLENGYSDVTSPTGTSYPDSNGGAGFGVNQVPDAAAQAIWEGEWGFVALRGVLRQIRIDNGSAVRRSDRYRDSALGYGIGATGALNLLDRRLIPAGSVNYGEGIGRYLDTSTACFGTVSNYGLPVGGDLRLDTVGVLSGMVGLQFHFTDTIRTNMSLHGVRLSYPEYVHDFAGCAGTAGTVCSSLNRHIWAGFANLIRSPVRPIDIGIEYVHVERALKNRDANGVRNGRADRIQASATVRF